MSRYRVALCGNPNVGKSTVFNALTGLRQHTGNWAGKTVESSSGIVKSASMEWELIDLPGAYSLFSGSPEEVVASDYLTFKPPDAVIVVCDAVCMERNLNLALQIAQACPKTILCVNMLDEAKKHGLSIDLIKLECLTACPVVGVTASKKQGLDELIRRTNDLLIRRKDEKCFTFSYSDLIEKEIAMLSGHIPKALNKRFAILRALAGSNDYIDKLSDICGQNISDEFTRAKSRLLYAGLSCESLIQLLIRQSYEHSEKLCSQVISRISTSKAEERQIKIDRLLADKRFGIPLMFLLLALVLYITMTGANIPSAFLSRFLTSLEPALAKFLYRINCPQFLCEMLVNGVYRVTSWVIAVMLPPMAIFFPLFTLLEDFGLLPRIAFNLDKCFQRCNACGKQALCMCMGLGCNAVGVTGCRIIQSPRERLLAILTNSLMPCNGRFPALMALITMFLCFSNASALGALWMSLLIALSVAVTFACSWLLSRTVLKGVPSAFTLELPPLRKPRFAQVLIRSALDRTLFVLGRAIAVAAPAGMLVWIAANVHINDLSLIRHAAGWLDPVGKLLGMDGVILLAFILGFPANEIVLPLMMMIYLDQGQLMELQGLEAFRSLLEMNGWTLTTAVCVTLFMLFHWPCSTTTITIYKETRSLRWTAGAILLPLLTGCTLCLIVSFISRILF